MKRIDAPECLCAECLAGTSRPAQDEIEYRLAQSIEPLTVQFEVGHGRPDLNMLYQIENQLRMRMAEVERLHPSDVFIYNTLINYLNNRRDDRPKETA